jgi:hypothetical protein
MRRVLTDEEVRERLERRVRVLLPLCSIAQLANIERLIGWEPTQQRFRGALHCRVRRKAAAHD